MGTDVTSAFVLFKQKNQRNWKIVGTFFKM